MFPESCRLCAGKAVKKIDRGREVTETGKGQSRDREGAEKRQGRDRAETGKGQSRDREGAEKRQGRGRAETGKGQSRDREGAEKGHGQEGPVGHLYHWPL